MNDDVVFEPAIPDDPEGGLVVRPLEHNGTIIASDRVAHLRERISALDWWGGEREWVGPDPYEGLNSRRLAWLKRTSVGRRILIQAVKRSPVDLRRPLGISVEPDAASVAHVLAARSALLSSSISTPEGVEWASNRLLELRAPAFEEPCWGYHFDVETRFFFYPRTEPNTIATAFAAHALLDAYAATSRANLLELAEGVGEFFLKRIGLTKVADGTGGGYFGYFPGDRTPIHNATALVAAVLARLYSLTARAEFGDAAEMGIRFVLGHQRRDGAWPYAEVAGRDWVDGLHTGYVLDSVRICGRGLGMSDAPAAYERGLRFYAARLFLENGTPKFFADRVHPIDAQYAAQAIRTFAEAAPLGGEWLEQAWRVYTFAISRLDRGDGAFAFQRHRFLLDRTPHVRWVQAPMLDALSRLLCASSAAR